MSSEMFSMWEAKTRYVLNYHLEEEKVDKAIAGVREYLDALMEVDAAE